MKISLVGISGITLGKFNIKDPRLDQAHKLVAADKKTYVQVDLVSDKEAADADAILVGTDARADLILKDWEFVETRAGRSPEPAEAAVLTKLKDALEKEQFAFKAGTYCGGAKACIRLQPGDPPSDRAGGRRGSRASGRLCSSSCCTKAAISAF